MRTAVVSQQTVVGTYESGMSINQLELAINGCRFLDDVQRHANEIPYHSPLAVNKSNEKNNNSNTRWARTTEPHRKRAEEISKSMVPHAGSHALLELVATPTNITNN